MDDGHGTEKIGLDLDDSDDWDADDVESELECWFPSVSLSWFVDKNAGEAGNFVFCMYDMVGTLFRVVSKSLVIFPRSNA